MLRFKTLENSWRHSEYCFALCECVWSKDIKSHVMQQKNLCVKTEYLFKKAKCYVTQTKKKQLKSEVMLTSKHWYLDNRSTCSAHAQDMSCLWTRLLVCHHFLNVKYVYLHFIFLFGFVWAFCHWPKRYRVRWQYDSRTLSYKVLAERGVAKYPDIGLRETANIQRTWRGLNRNPYRAEEYI
jgi:hypothetical protein